MAQSMSRWASSMGEGDDLDVLGQKYRASKECKKRLQSQSHRTMTLLGDDYALDYYDISETKEEKKWVKTSLKI